MNMTSNWRNPVLWQRLLVALLIIAATSVFRAVFFGALGRGIPYLLYYPAVTLAALYGGLAAGFLATALSALLCFFWIQRGFLSPVESLALAVFISSCMMISLVCEAMRRTHQRAKVAQGEAVAAAEELRTEVAERQRAEAALREKEQRLSESQRIAHIGSWSWNLTGPIHWTDETYRIYGVSPETFTPTVESLIQLVHPEDRPLMQRWMAACVAEEKPGDLEFRSLRPDGTVRFLNGRGELRYDEAGKPFQLVVGTTQDITERKQAEEMIRRERDFSQTALESLPGLFYLFDEQGRFLRLNKNFERVSGYSAAELARLTPLDLFSGTDQARIAAAIQQGLQTGEVTVEAKFLSKDQTQTPFIFTGKLFHFDQKSCIMGMGLDISQLKHMEEELRASEERFRRTVLNSPFPIMLHAEDGAVLQTSHSWCEITGYSPNEIATIADWTERAYGDRKTLVRAEIDALYKLEHRKHEGDRSIRTKDGSPRIWEFSFAAAGCLPDGRRLIISMAMDVTERRAAEAKLQGTLADLERSNKELEQFASVASHDLQEPLRMVSSYTQLLGQRYAAHLDVRAKKYITYAVDGALRMQALINDLLAYSRVGTRVQALEPTDAHAVLGEAIRNLAATIQEHRALITTDDLPRVRADASQLALVFQNLLANAIKFHREESPHIHVSARDQERAWRFSVKDNGIGIEPQHAERVFVIFQRLHTRAEYPGTGIGLAVCRRIVERHGGKIWFESEPGKGTTFFFTIPK